MNSLEMMQKIGGKIITKNYLRLLHDRNLFLQFGFYFSFPPTHKQAINTSKASKNSECHDCLMVQCSDATPEVVSANQNHTQMLRCLIWDSFRTFQASDRTGSAHLNLLKSTCHLPGKYDVHLHFIALTVIFLTLKLYVCLTYQWYCMQADISFVDQISHVMVQKKFLSLCSVAFDSGGEFQHIHHRYMNMYMYVHSDYPNRCLYSKGTSYF